ncbi:FAD-dependent monooxygenase [Micromonosporaceae bacterium Da 78-11]
MLPEHVPVLIAGGGPVGLATAIELGRRGIDCLIVEPREVVSHARPRCKTVSVRSMEHLRRWGLADRLRKHAPLPTSWSQDAVFCTSLTGRELSRFSGVLGLTTEGDRFAELGQQAPQYVFEEVLRDAVAEIPACTLVTGCRVAEIEQDDTGVRTWVVDQAGTRVRVNADYLIGCDGPRSAVRTQIGAGYGGGQALRPNFGMVFEAPDLWPQVAHGPAVHYWIINSVAPALMGPIDRTGTWWMIAFGIDRATGEARARDLIDAAVGRPVEARVTATDPWTAQMQIVDRMRSGRVFLAGDAAHLNPPFGGHGLNTGLGDAVDLGWKIAAVLDGWGGPALLDSYETERRPVQERVIREATANMAVLSADLITDHLDAPDLAGDQARLAAGRRIQETKKAEFHSLDLVLDVGIAGTTVVTDSGGDRLPHLWLGEDRSLYDELGPGYTLLVLGGDPDDVAAIERAGQSSRVPLTTLDLRELGLRDRYGADLLLVRPDQHVAWRGDQAPVDPVGLLDHLRGGG